MHRFIVLSVVLAASASNAQTDVDWDAVEIDPVPIRSSRSVIGNDSVPASPPGALPKITFSDEVNFCWNDDEITSFVSRARIPTATRSFTSGAPA
jgi:hypothetical protein